MRFIWIAVSIGASLALVAHALSQENVQAPTEIDLPEDGGEEAADAGPAQPAPPPWDGTFAEGMAEVVRLAASEDDSAAMDVADRLLEDTRYARLRTSLETRTRGWSERVLGRLEQPLTWLGYETFTSADRAEVRYARGLLRARSGAVISADEDLDLARVLAGDGATRQDAVYALGTLDLAVAEELRQKIPEISGAPPNQVPGAASTPGGSSGTGPVAGLPGAPPEEAPDPLELARAAYQAAREHFVERLRLDWHDANTRANVELVQRRLRELEEIEQRREEQEQEQQQNEQQQDQEQDPDQEGEEQESDDEQEQDAEQDPEKDKEPEEKDPEEQDSEEEQESESEEQEGEPEERFLTEEEMQRLLQLLRQYSEQGEELEKTLQGVRRERVERDW